ncbi:RHS repeat-associated core domain-containing protein [Andreprevotia chitinilytica]|uniref:RHS repeat-associated core domain-containing protein n=1 Tax=Andreprevotia chitinilytica TaxID=396808 RepID=UPI000691075A|nr:RHS repeat-associated core domain-containing protein [Andreprevotia chitinilytica]
MRLNSYDNVGNVSTINDAAHSSLNQNFSYDVLDRLTLGNVGGVGFNYGYDQNGNRVNANNGSNNTDYHYDPASNKLLSTTGSNAATYQYDASGNQTQSGNITNTYNNAGRVIQSTVNGQTWTYSYNAIGQRLQKSGPTGTTRFVYDEAGHLIGEYDATGKVVQETVWLGDTPIATIRPTADPQNPKTYYVWADHLGTPRQVTDPTSNAVVWRWEGEAFGNSLPNQDPSSTGQQFIYNLRFAGQVYDAETGNFYNDFRNYDPITGGYTSSDPIGLDAGQFSTYAYVDGNPLSYIDPFGLSGLDENSLEHEHEPPGFVETHTQIQGIVHDAHKLIVPICPCPLLCGGAAKGGTPSLAKGASNTGRAGKQARLRELANEDKLGSADRGWINQELNSIARGQRATIRNPPGKDLAHERGREAAKGYDYSHSNLQDRDLHRLQHKYDDFGRANAERPPQ